MRPSWDDKNKLKFSTLSDDEITSRVPQFSVVYTLVPIIETHIAMKMKQLRPMGAPSFAVFEQWVFALYSASKRQIQADSNENENNTNKIIRCD